MKKEENWFYIASTSLVWLAVFTVFLCFVVGYLSSGKRPTVEVPVGLLGICLLCIIGIPLLFVSDLFSRTLDFFLGQERELDWPDALPVGLSFVVVLCVMGYQWASAITPYQMERMTWLLSTWLTAQLLAMAVVLRVVSERRRLRPMSYIVLGFVGFIATIIIFPIFFRARENRRMAVQSEIKIVSVAKAPHSNR